MVTRFAICAVCATVALAVAGSARAQTVPEGQSCGGLLCDLGVFGHKTAPAEAAPPPARNVAAVPPPAATVAAPAPDVAAPAPKKRVAHKKKPAATVVAVPSSPAPVAARPVAAAPAALPPRARPQAQTSISPPLAAPPQPAGLLFQPIYQ